MANQKVMTAPLAKIVIGGIVVGKMKDIRVTENFRRGDIKGIGELASQEKPIIGWDGSFSCSFYTIDLKAVGNIPGSKLGLNRQAGDMLTFVNTVLLQEKGIDIYIYKKFAQVVNETTGLVESTGDGEFAIIRQAFVESQGFDISEGQISGTNQSFTYLEPILFDK